MMSDFQELLTHGFATFFGTFILYILNRNNGNQPFSLFRAINLRINNKSKPLIVVSDMIISSIIGSFAVLMLIGPDTIPECIAAGLGMSGLFSAYSEKIKKEHSLDHHKHSKAK